MCIFETETETKKMVETETEIEIDSLADLCFAAQPTTAWSLVIGGGPEEIFPMFFVLFFKEICHCRGVEFLHLVLRRMEEISPAMVESQHIYATAAHTGGKLELSLDIWRFKVCNYPKEFFNIEI